MTDTPSPLRGFTVVGDAGRLDRHLAAAGPLAGRGRRHLATLIASGAVRVNGKVARKGTIVRAGDVITVREAASAPIADPSALVLLHVSDEIVAVDKPPGFPTTIGSTDGPSLAAALLARFPEMRTIDARHAGLVHRLDTGTSGLLIAARSRATHDRLRAAFAAKRVTKEYLAVAVGRLQGRHLVTHPLARHPKSRGRMIVARHTARAWAAETEVTPIAGDADFTLVRLRMRTGVTHQLRVHLATLGHPILGDLRYGLSTPATMPPEIVSSRWHFLHAHAIALTDVELPDPIVTPFPEHWGPFFAARGWEPEVIERA